MKYISTEIINKIINKVNNGGVLKRNELIFHQGMIGTLNNKYPYLYSYEEMVEWAKCYNDPFYFIEKYCKYILEDSNIGFVKLRDYQKKIIENLKNYRFNIFLNSRQIGFSYIASCLILWEMIFYKKNVLIIANKYCIGIEHIEKIKKIYLNLPYFLKPRVNVWNKKELSFTDAKVIVGNNIISDYDIVHIVDAFDFSLQYQLKILNDFPCLSKDCRLVISGNPSVGPFYNLTSIFNTLRTYWWQVSGRDENWKRDRIRELGSEESFDKEYNLSFINKS